MLRSINELEGYKIQAKDDNIGKIYDCFFDDVSWTCRYFVIDTGGWLPGKKVLISPFSVGKPDWDKKEFPVNLTKSQIEKSPDVDEHQPLERQKEIELTSYYGWPDYWAGGMAAPVGGYPPNAVPAGDVIRNEAEILTDQQPDVHLHSARSIVDYNIQATDENVGHVEDFILDDTDWSIRYIIVDTHNWLPGGKKVILSPHWIKRMDWASSEVYIDLTKEQIKNSPEWDPSQPLQRDYETRLHEHYDKKIYW